MKIRRLQRLNDDHRWEDHGYAFEREDGQCLFRFNTLVWGRIGARYNAEMEESGTKLDDVHSVILTEDNFRWLDVEEIKGKAEAIRATLDEQCQIPTISPVQIEKTAAA